MKRSLPCLLIILLALATAVHAQEIPAPAGEEARAVEPALDRREIVVPGIDTESFEVSLYGGVLNVENFGGEPVYGLRVAFHLAQDLFIEASYGRSEVSDDVFHRFGPPLFASRSEDLEYYHASLGYTILPAEFFFGKRRAFAGGLYLVGGAGVTEFDGDDEFTYNLGLGVRLFPTDWLVLRSELRGYAMEWDVFGEEENAYHMEATLNIGVFF